MSELRAARPKGRPSKNAAPPGEIVYLIQLTKESYRCTFDGCNAVIMYRQNARRHVQEMHLRFVQFASPESLGKSQRCLIMIYLFAWITACILET